MTLLMTLWDNPDQALVRLAGWAADWPGRVHPALGELAIMALSTAPLIAVFAGLFALTTWVERKGLARIQNRPGPNRAGPLGLLQPVADGIKMLFKEDIAPDGADRLGHFLAPVMVMVPATVVTGFLPYGRNMTPVAMESALVLFFAIGSLTTLAVFLAGWSSRNKYSLLGGMRAIAQMVSYEVPLVLSAVVAVMFSGSLNTARIVEAQQIGAWVGSDSPLLQALGQICGWYVFTPWGLTAFAIFFTASVAEANRSPFDLPEADSEIIAGHLTEYSGFKYALFFIAEYIGAFASAGLAAALFLGGWSGPNIRPPWSREAGGLLIPGFVWFFAKMYGLFLVMIWARGTLPRLRVDQLMAFAWKFLMPMALVNIVAAGIYYHAPRWAGWPASAALIAATYLLLSRILIPGSGSPREYRYSG